MADKKKTDAPAAPAPKAHEVSPSTFDLDKPPDETGTTSSPDERPPGSSDIVAPDKATSTVRAYAAEKKVIAAALLPFVGGGDIDRAIELEKLDAALAKMEGR